MLSQAINDLTWHFLGYLKLQKFAVSHKTIYSGATSDQVSVAIGEFNDQDPVISQQTDTAEVNSLHTPQLSELKPPKGTSSTELTTKELISVQEGPQNQIIQFTPQVDDISATSTPDANFIDPDFRIEAMYRSIDDPDIVISQHQANVLTDDDILVQDHIVWSPDSDAPTPQVMLETLLEKASSDTTNEYIGNTDFSNQADLQDYSDLVVSRLESGETQIVNITSGENIGHWRKPDSQIPDLDKTNVIELGNNEATNAAAIVDSSEAYCSLAVMGNYYSSNVILQANYFAGNNNVRTSNKAPQSPLTIENKAQIKSEGEVRIPAKISVHNPDYTFHVDVVKGDFFDVNCINQVNYLSDNDRICYEVQSSGYYINLGDNTQVNAAQIIDMVHTYDMVFIAGNYYDLNQINQKNYLLDRDYVANESQAVNSGSNSMYNDATITEIGGNDQFRPVNSSINNLANDLFNLKKSIDFDVHDYNGGLPQIGTTSLRVLVVSGDYYQVNSINQVNIISDADQGRIVTAKQMAGTYKRHFANDDPNAKANYYSTSNNSATNKAVIVDYDSQSEFQYLGGSYSEEEVIIQLNDVDCTPQNQQVSGKTQLATEVVAFTNDDVATNNDYSSGIQQAAPYSDFISDNLA
ncbi:hypothetical protein [Polycladidibacter stylochi]|uniref:hypothetical protein n=1 Tax=Polycladidibacter stylochi TaxID=1807766 RepID=UPI0008328B00|nr:hypothetical protein [Pseudovibrio stylochi]